MVCGVIHSIQAIEVLGIISKSDDEIAQQGKTLS